MTKNAARVLIVDDDAGHRAMLETLLGSWGYKVFEAVDGLEAVDKIRETAYDVVLMDIRMARMDGLTALKAIKTYNPAVPIVIMTAHSAVESAVEAIKSGAYDYLVKPLDFDTLKLTLSRTLEHSTLKAEVDNLRSALASRQDKGGVDIIGQSPAMRDMLELMHTVAPSEATILITGESGTGKELVAKAIHGLSARRNGPFVAVNCAAIAQNLLESELFGHEKGAFTGADRRRDGFFIHAGGGSIFLDEIGEISPAMQAKLLRVLQQREIQRVGGDGIVSVDVRIIAATNRCLEDEVKAGRFREDLFYRLNVVNVHVPPLRARREDIPLLAGHFLVVYAARNRKQIKGFTPRAMDILLKYDWPGNVRELENVVERAVVLLAGAYVSDMELPPSLTGARAEPAVDREGAPSYEGKLEDIEREAILHTLRQTGDNKSEAARRLGISRKTLHSKLNQYSV